ncbi:hypothetical protein UP09_05450 [Bradyrhizobium sp. LTSP885]|nr:hypothetical protein UP09_05450 [Bradyrhizobium sp. LTSP885]
MSSVGLQVERLNKIYDGFAAVSDLSFEIKAGEIVAFLGPSGCGKTTCLRMIAGLVAPTSGTILLGNRDITAVSVHRRNIGMLFQNYALFPHLTVAENVAFGLKMRKVSRAEVSERVKTALQLVQLPQFADRLPARLSGGQQQRVALARALAIEPSLLLLDEPLGALDKNLRDEMQVELLQLQRRLGITTVIVTHDQEEALTLSDRVLVLKDGKFQQYGRSEDVYLRPENEFVAGFVGVSNCFRGEVDREDGLARLRTESGLSIMLPPSVETAQSTTVVVRPENITLKPLGTGGGSDTNAIPVVIEQIIYRGVQTHYHLATDDGQKLIVFAQNSEGAVASGLPGSRAVATWKVATTHVIPNQPRT